MNISFKLFRLQQIDSQIDRIHTRLLVIEGILKDDSVLKLAFSQIENITIKLNEARKSVHLAELDVQSQRIKIEQTEASLYGSKSRSPKECQDLENESASLKRYMSILEDRQLDAMMSQETIDEQEAEAKRSLETIQIQISKQNGSLIDEKNALLKDLHNQETERQAATISITSEWLGLYEQLRLSRRGVAVAKVSDRACEACGTTLSATLLSAARSPSQIARCATCGRILYAG